MPRVGGGWVRRGLRASGLLLLTGLLILESQLVSQAENRKTTYVYKQVGDLAIRADVHRSDDVAVQPVLVWIHGGALINGHRESIDRRLKDPLLEAGCTLVSIDYRLAPETQLPAIIEDLADAFRWVRDKGPELFQADPARIAVAGGSAGGYLTLTAGYRVEPRPVALVALWGYGDLIGPWYSEPSPHPRHQQPKLTRDEAYRQVAGSPVSDARDRRGDGGAFYQFCRQHGHWPQAVSGWNPHREPEKFAPFMPVKNVSSRYPPTFLIHGENDTDVPHEQSVLMVEQFRQHGVPHRLVSVARGEHGLGGADREEIEQAYAAALAFLKQHLQLP